jgi:hypothetical protein
MNTSASTTNGSSARKKPKLAAASETKENAADPELVDPTQIIAMVATNGWFPWQDVEKMQQNPDYSNLRLVSKEMKRMMDKPSCGGPNFDVIAAFLDCKNGFDDDDEGFCDHCFLNEGERCDTCQGYNYECCPCKEPHRFGDSIRKLDPRLGFGDQFKELPARQRAKLLLRFLVRVSSNFHCHIYSQWQKQWENDWQMQWENELTNEPDLTLVDPRMWNPEGGLLSEMQQYNLPFYNFIHHMLFIGWAENDTYCSPGSCSPYRGEFLQDKRLSQCGWNGGHRELFDDIINCFLRLHKSDDTRVVRQNRGRGYEFEEPYTLSQIQYLPETIRRCVENIVDEKARTLLGRPIADAIDLYRLVGSTYQLRQEELSQIEWMPCFGMEEEEYEPLDDFSGYNPQHSRSNIDGTGLLWTKKEIVEGNY